VERLRSKSFRYSSALQLIQRASVKHPRLKFDVKPFVGDASTVLDAIADYAAS
jgi:hypothetical protein